LTRQPKMSDCPAQLFFDVGMKSHVRD